MNDFAKNLTHPYFRQISIVFQLNIMFRVTVCFYRQHVYLQAKLIVLVAVSRTMAMAAKDTRIASRDIPHEHLLQELSRFMFTTEGELDM